ncbi:hypothetical protein J421_0910 [Gemmatirosa kalamazoonensis]|uniref:Lipoprotein n=1 Tax=Gemmatirosa kalamazoonensis TaxID=861299 RepID=W0RDC8_9BACT|nr:hypothetical protein [Gemmatirosa kalamazoonensis]AHG88447.1 hypothetical protein J421_0910 [Gemmatirosa kalamazoonensis]
MRSSSIVLSSAAMLCAACASSSRAPSSAPAASPSPTPANGPTVGAPEIARTVNLETRDGRLLVAGVEIHQSTDTFRGSEVGAPAAKLWATLPAVYDQLGLPINGVDAEKRAVAAVNLRARVQLNKVRLSRYVDCGGAGSIGGRAADSYTVTFNVATQVVPLSDDRATVATLVQAFGQPSSNSGQPVHCTSTGNLEAQVAQLAAAHVAP